MDLVTATREVPRQGSGNVVAIGKWDGVHVAHQRIVRSLVGEAKRTDGQSVVMGFHPLPMTVLRPDDAPPMIQTLMERAGTLAGLGVDVHLVLPFDHHLAAMTPEEFVRAVLVEELQARKVMVGFNFTFARGGKATAETLKLLCSQHGIPVEIFEPVRINGENVSSTEVRFYVASGQMDRVTQLLGRPFSLQGAVVEGDKRGRQLGYPTANMQMGQRRQLPANGVYVARVTILDLADSDLQTVPTQVSPRSGPTYAAMLNLGLRPTFQGQDLRCEAHLLDFNGNLYGRELKVEFLHRLRGERAFQGIEGLKAQLADDEAAVRAYLKHHG